AQADERGLAQGYAGAAPLAVLRAGEDRHRVPGVLARRACPWLPVSEQMSTKLQSYPLRPFMPADTMALRDLFAQSIEELTADDYTEDQRLAWIARAEDAEAFADRLEGMVTLIVQVDGEYLGFASLKDNSVIDMLYVHPYATGRGVGTSLVDALERLAT